MPHEQVTPLHATRGFLSSRFMQSEEMTLSATSVCAEFNGSQLVPVGDVNKASYQLGFAGTVVASTVIMAVDKSNDGITWVDDVVLLSGDGTGFALVSAVDSKYHRVRVKTGADARGRITARLWAEV